MLHQCIYIFAALSAAFVDIIFLAGIEMKDATHMLNLVHLVSFAIVFGINMWNVFLAGFLLIRSIPRHMFGKAQGNILPAYFSISFSMLCIVLGVIFLQYPYHDFEEWTDELMYQVFALATAMILFAVLLLFVFPTTQKIISKMYMFEREVGLGEEIALKAPINEELEMNDEYKKTKKKFHMWHGISMLTNLFIVGLLWYHAYYLAGCLSLAGSRTVATQTDRSQTADI